MRKIFKNTEFYLVSIFPVYGLNMGKYGLSIFPEYIRTLMAF